MEKRPGIYKITNKNTKKSYVGSAIDIYTRIHSHKHHLRKNTHVNRKLQNSWNKHEEVSFEFYVLEYVDDKEHLMMREQHWMNYFDVIECGYNILPNARRSIGRIVSKETREKLRVAQTGKKLTDETRKKISDKKSGKKLSEYHIQRLRERVFTDEWRRNLCLSKIDIAYSENALKNWKTSGLKRKFRTNMKDIGFDFSFKSISSSPRYATALSQLSL